jgi:type II secretory pathway pseudopilin PulG
MKKKSASRKDGYILTEILVALIIASIAFALVLGAIAHSASATHTIGQTIKEVIQERNSYVENRTTVFQADQQ